MLLVYLVYLVDLVRLLPDRQDRHLPPDRPLRTQLRPLTYSKVRRRKHGSTGGDTTRHPIQNHLGRRHERQHLSIRNMMPPQIFLVMSGEIEISEQNRIEFPLVQGVWPHHRIGQE